MFTIAVNAHTLLFVSSRRFVCMCVLSVVSGVASVLFMSEVNVVFDVLRFKKQF